MLFGDEFKRLVTLSFRQDSEGREVFYLFWTRGRGRVLSDAAFADKMRKRMLWSSRLVVLVLTIAVLIPALMWPVDIPRTIGESIGIIAVGLGCQWLYLFWHIRNLPVSIERQGYWEGQRRYWRTCSTRSLIFIAAASAGAVFFSVWCLLRDPAGERWNDILLLITAAAGFTVNLPQLIWKLRQSKSGQGSI
jgi:hypothetical protein